MEFALTRKQLNKKREKEQAAGAPAPVDAPPAAPGAAPPAPASTSGVDPVTGLPVGYDPPAPTLSPGAGSEFFTSNAGVLGRQPPPAAAPAPAPAPGPGFATFEAPPPPPAPPGAAPSFDTLLPPSFATSPPPAPAPAPAPAGAAPVVAPPPPAPAPVAVRAPQRAADALIVGDRPRGGELVAVVVRRYAGFILFLLIAIALVALVPSLRHSNSSPSGLGPVPTVGPSAAAAPTAGPGWTAGAGVVAVSVSYS